MQPAQAPSAASRKPRTERTATWIEKHGVKPALPHDWTEKEVTLQQLVDFGMLTEAEAAREAGADLVLPLILTEMLLPPLLHLTSVPRCCFTRSSHRQRIH